MKWLLSLLTVVIAGAIGGLPVGFGVAGALIIASAFVYLPTDPVEGPAISETWFTRWLARRSTFISDSVEPPPPRDPFLALLAAIPSMGPEARRRALERLGESGDLRALPLLEELSDSRFSHPDVEAAAASALERLRQQVDRQRGALSVMASSGPGAVALAEDSEEG